MKIGGSSTTFFEFLAAAARAWLVAPDLGLQSLGQSVVLRAKVIFSQ